MAPMILYVPLRRDLLERLIAASVLFVLALAVYFTGRALGWWGPLGP